MKAKRLAVLKTYKLFIGGAFPRSESGRVRPALAGDGKTVLGNYAQASRKDFRDAVLKTRAAQSKWASSRARISAASGISESFPTKSNTGGMAVIDRLWTERKDGLIFANLVDFDMLFGHRRDVEGYARRWKASTAGSRISFPAFHPAIS